MYYVRLGIRGVSMGVSKGAIPLPGSNTIDLVYYLKKIIYKNPVAPLPSKKSMATPLLGI